MIGEFRSKGLWWADLVMEGTFFLMQKYLTDVWKFSFTTAASFLNIWGGIYRILPIFFLFLADTLLGNFATLALSAIFSITGLVLITVATSIGYRCHKKGETECVGHTQKALFITGMALVALGRAARFASAKPFVDDQTNENIDDHHTDSTNNDQTNNNVDDDQTDSTNNDLQTINNVDDDQTDKDSDRRGYWQSKIKRMVGSVPLIVFLISVAVFLFMPAVAFFVFPYVKEWYILFGVSAICTVFATACFLSGFLEYNKPGPRAEGSPITDFLRVFVAATINICRPSPNVEDDQRLLYVRDGEEFKKLYPSRLLGFMHKAALKLDDDDDDTTAESGVAKKRSWRVCSVSEVESAKIVIRMFLVYTTYLMCGLVSSIGNTYVVEQASHMNYNIGRWKPPLQVLQLIFMVCKVFVKNNYKGSVYHRKNQDEEAYDSAFGGSMFSTICCTVAAAVERRRLHVVRRHDLLDQPDDAKIPMSAFWLLLPVIFQGSAEAVMEIGLFEFHKREAPQAMTRYCDCLGEGVRGFGFMCGALSVYVVGKVSEIGGGKNWFRHTLNRSRLDRYYWVLSVLTSLNLFLSLVVAEYYTRKLTLINAQEEEQKEEVQGEEEEEHDDDKQEEEETNSNENRVLIAT